jgi:hypothetical protein
MATAKQIAANRANSRLSTGPKTEVGRLKSSRNALRHGLSGSLQMDGNALVKIEAMARVLADESTNEERRQAARELAESQLELSRIRGIRNELMMSLNSQHCSLQQLKRVAALDRYERWAVSKRRRAQLKLLVGPGGDGERTRAVGSRSGF